MFPPLNEKEAYALLPFINVITYEAYDGTYCQAKLVCVLLLSEGPISQKHIWPQIGSCPYRRTGFHAISLP